jgi:hypothetical protein
MTNIPSESPISPRPPAGPVRRHARRGAAALPRSSRRRCLHRFLCLLAFVPWASAAAQVSAEQPAGEGGDKKPPQAMVRAFLVPSEGGGGSLQLVVKPQQADAGVAPQVVALSDGAATFSASYQRIDPGSVVLELRAGDKVLATDAGALRPARAYTFVAWQAPPGGWQIKAFPDDPASPSAADRALRILNFPAGRETLLSIDRGAETRVPGNAVQEIRAQAKVVAASVKVLAPDGGPPALSTLEIDYTTLGSGYLVVMPDNLGRMRPQFIGGGYEEEVELAPRPTTAAAPVTVEAVREQRITGAQMELDQQETILKMIAAREAAMGGNASATLLENKREAEKRLAELKKNLEAARSAPARPGNAAPASVENPQQ